MCVRSGALLGAEGAVRQSRLALSCLALHGSVTRVSNAPASAGGLTRGTRGMSAARSCERVASLGETPAVGTSSLDFRELAVRKPAARGSERKASNGAGAGQVEAAKQSIKPCPGISSSDHIVMYHVSCIMDETPYGLGRTPCTCA